MVLEVGGEGTPGWDVRYVDQPSSQGKGDPVEVAGDAVLQVTLTGAGYPYDTGVEEYSAAGPLSVPDTETVTEVVFDATFEGTTVAFVGTKARAPFRVYLLEAPTRVVLEVAHARLRPRRRQAREAVISTASSVTLVHSSWSGPAATLSPSAQETLAPPTLSDARPSWMPPNVTVVPEDLGLGAVAGQRGGAGARRARDVVRAEGAAGQRGEDQAPGEEPRGEAGGARHRGHAPSVGPPGQSGRGRGRLAALVGGVRPRSSAAAARTVRCMVTSVSPEPGEGDLVVGAELAGVPVEVEDGAGEGLGVVALEPAQARAAGGPLHHQQGAVRRAR